MVKVFHVLGRDGLVVVSILTKSRGEKQTFSCKIKARLAVILKVIPKICQQLYISLAFTDITK